MTRTRLLAVLAAALAGQPAFAADDYREPAFASDIRTGAFAGAQIRVPLGRAERARDRPTAGLQLGFERRAGDPRSSAPIRVHRTSAIELGFSRQERPSLTVAGTPMRQMQRRLGVSTVGGVAIGAGVILAVLLVVAASSDMPDEITP